ncbi:MAG: peptide ABC transporter permease [candidate division NC10 bacterium RBG_16_65_8]|nr:MAG: peptide ABC transporter permease [candidate division NC10 bacterium RBG_16_65_8]
MAGSAARRTTRPTAQRAVVWRQFRKNRLAVGGGLVVVALGLVAALAPLLAPYDPAAYDVKQILLSPSAAHWFGTDQLGRDVLSRMLFGSRISMAVGFVSIGIAVLVGTLIGTVAAYYGGRVDEVLMRFVDLMLNFPRFFLLLTLIALLRPSIWVIMAVIGFTGWMGLARLVRGEILSLREREFVQGARALGAPDLRIMFRHILPNALVPVLVSATLGVAGAILTESGLSFLGLGVQPPTPSWGNILIDGKANIEIAWWLSVFPGLAILMTVLAYNLFGEGLRDALDPRLRR